MCCCLVVQVIDINSWVKCSLYWSHPLISPFTRTPSLLVLNSIKPWWGGGWLDSWILSFISMFVTCYRGPRKFCQRDAGPDLPLNTTCGIFLGVFLSAFIFSLVHLGITLDNLFGVTFYTFFWLDFSLVAEMASAVAGNIVILLFLTWVGPASPCLVLTNVSIMILISRTTLF